MTRRRKVGLTHTAGRWSPAEKNLYFVASGCEILDYVAAQVRDKLVAVNEIRTPEHLAVLARAVEAGDRVFIDSGIFNLTNEHARAHGVSMDVALSLPPEKIDGFDALLARYLEIIEKLGPGIWGYIELDQGGRENKIKTRARLEAMGLRPIPVYHPLNDGWDYFDYLAERYDRICFGNVVQASAPVRKRLVATAWERRRRFPNLWIHLLGLTANEMLNACPIDSCDSSSWLSAVRFGVPEAAHSALKVWSRLPKSAAPKIGAGPDDLLGHRHAWRIGAKNATMLGRNWRTHAGEVARVLGEDGRGTKA